MKQPDAVMDPELRVPPDVPDLGAELSEDDLEHVVGGLARVRIDALDEVLDPRNA